MSAPNLPRFTVGSVTGFPTDSHASRPGLVWGVRDSWWNYALVREFTGKHAEKRARTLASKLERRHEPFEIPATSRLTHGMESTYVHLGCRCDDCRRVHTRAVYARAERRKMRDASV